MKMEHLDSELQLGYVYRTLDDAERESIDAHLAICPQCRAQLDRQKHARKRIRREIGLALNSAAPSGQMAFAGIADRVRPPGIWRSIWQSLAEGAPALLALAGLFLTLYGLSDVVQGIAGAGRPDALPGPYPTLAVFFFLLASVQGIEPPFLIRPRLWLQGLIAGILWLGSALIGLLNIIVIRDLTIAAVLATGGTAAEAVPVTILSIMVSVLIYIGVVIGGADHHFRNLGQAGSWKLFSLTLLGQLFLLILPYLILP